MRRAAVLLTVVVPAVLLQTGCRLREVPWEPIERPYKWGGWFGPHFGLTLPEGWIRLDDQSDGVVATRDGFGLQRIVVRRLHVNDALKNTKKRLREGMSPQELAEVLLDDVRADASRSAVKVLETRPATVSGQRGFRATLAYNEDGLQRQEVVVGLLTGSTLWRVSYLAPARHYFALDLRTFDTAMESFQVW